MEEGRRGRGRRECTSETVGESERMGERKGWNGEREREEEKQSLTQSGLQTLCMVQTMRSCRGSGNKANSNYTHYIVLTLQLLHILAIL